MSGNLVGPYQPQPDDELEQLAQDEQLEQPGREARDGLDERLARMAPEAIARVCHEANRAVQIEQADPTIAVSPPWDDTDPETRASAVDGVRAVLDGADPEASHENWVRFKVDHGWTYGPVKDLDRKEHPLLIPYGDLPYEQRAKDALFHAIVHALA